MKIKSHSFKWAMALCAIAVFSFTAAREAHANRIIVGPPLPPILTVDSVGKSPPKIRILPPPSIDPVVPIGVIRGTVIVD